MNADDPKLTAYALDELDAAERKEVEQLLGTDPAAMAELEATRAFAAQLRTRLKAERAEGLHPAQRAELLSGVSAEWSRKVVAFPRRAVVWGALAAGVLVGVSWALIFPALKKMERPLATRVVASSVHTAKAPRDGSEVQVALAPDPSPDAGESSDILRGIAATDALGGEGASRLAMGAPKPAASSPGVGAPLPDRPNSRFVTARPLELALDAPPAPATSPKEPQSSSVKLLLSEAQGFSDSARYDLAEKRGEEILAVDPYNIAARNLEGKINAKRKAFVSSTSDEARSRAVWKTDFAWANPVRKFDRGLSSHERLASVPSKVRPRFGTEHDSGGVASLSTIDKGSDGAGFASEAPGSESYEDVADTAFLKVTDAPLSTFSIDVDTASYANVRRFLNANTLPPKAAVRIEELVNYFHYDYPQPDAETPFSAAMEIAACPWAPEHRLLRVALHGRDIARAARPASNLIFLIDVSGSMQPENKLPLLKRSLQLMVDQLGERDQVAIVVYAGAAGCVLESTHSKDKIRGALDRLESGGSTHGSAGLQLAYELAEKHFIKGGTNRVILATDGDWNVGVTDKGDLWSMIEKKAKSGVFLTVLGFGMDNLKDDMLEKLADKGNGNYAYIDTLNEGRKVLVDELGATLVTIAKDVKIQIEFNPAQVGAYRLIVYENRVMAAKDFADDAKDAGEIGAGHSVTAFYEIIPAGVAMPVPAVEPLKYQTAPVVAQKPEVRSQKSDFPDELLTLKLRYKAPDADTSTLREFPFRDSGHSIAQSSRDFRFAAAVAGYGMMLRGSPHKGGANWAQIHELAIEGKGEDRDGYRAEFVGLVEKARALMR